MFAHVSRVLLFVYSLIAMSAVTVLAACGDKAEAAKSVDAASPAEGATVAGDTPRSAKAAVNVWTMTLVPSQYREREKLRAVAEPYAAVTVSAETSGRIEAIGPREGATIGRGAELARVDARLAEAQLKDAQAAFDLAVVTFDRQQQLQKTGNATQADLDTAKANRERADAARMQAALALEKAVIKSPVGGTVSVKYAELGEMVAPGARLYRVVDTHVLKVMAALPERLITLAKPGIEVSVTFDAFAGEPVTGKIVRIGVEADTASRTFPVEIQVDNKHGQYRAGLLAAVDLPTRELADVVVAPRDAVIEDGPLKYVYVTADGKTARRVDVRLGGTTGGVTHIIEGLKAGDRLIVTGHRALSEGDEIRVTGETPCCGAAAPAAAPLAAR